MGVWCRQNGITSLYAAHTIDDQAETFILRLARGSGVDGLSAMKIVAHFPSPGCEGLRVVRPLLGASRRSLRDYLSARGEGWREDEMNKDMRFARARLRAAWPALEGVGLTTLRIASAARHLARARTALDKDVQQLLDRATRKGRGHVLADAAQLGAAPDEIGLRALACLLIDVSGQYQRPRFERLEKLFTAIRSGALGGGRTLHGCRVYPAPKREAVFGAGTLRIGREAKRSGLVRSE
jgi:tRNA(Ile)-lysidine synthase